MTKTFLVIFLITAQGQDAGGPPIEAPSLEQCLAVAAKIVADKTPQGFTEHGAGCVTYRKADTPA